MRDGAFKAVGNEEWSNQISVTHVKSLISEILQDLPQKAGAIFGLPASGYLELDERPVIRTAMDGIVVEIECDADVGEEIIRETEPVDFARRPDGRSAIFVWYANRDLADEYRDAFRKLREGNLVIA